MTECPNDVMLLLYNQLWVEFHCRTPRPPPHPKQTSNHTRCLHDMTDVRSSWEDERCRQPGINIKPTALLTRAHIKGAFVLWHKWRIQI